MRYVALFLLLALLIPVANAEVIKIGVIGPMQTKYGLAMKHAVELAAKEINEHGGILGRKIVVITADTRFDSNTATTAFRDLVDRGCKVIIGGFASGVASGAFDDGYDGGFGQNWT